MKFTLSKYSSYAPKSISNRLATRLGKNRRPVSRLLRSSNLARQARSPTLSRGVPELPAPCFAFPRVSGLLLPRALIGDAPVRPATADIHLSPGLASPLPRSRSTLLRPLTLPRPATGSCKASIHAQRQCLPLDTDQERGAR